MINKTPIQNHLNDAMMSMSAYALLQRAIPDLRDGFKPVNRRVITSMHINNTTSFTKSATVEGRVMQLHPHGGSYGSIVGLVQRDRQNLPFLTGKGSWGQHTSKDHSAAAARYTEVKLGKNALEIIKELKEKSVNLIPNYDGTQMIPEVLPVTYPTILTQSQDGMAIGFASSILSYNLLELRDQIKNYYDGKNIDAIYPDFPTGGSIIKDDETAKEIMKNGRGSLKIRAKIDIDKKNKRLIVNELPYGVKRESVINKIIDLNKSGKLKEITDVRDGTSFKGMKIVIKFRRNTNEDELIAKLYQLTPLQSSVSANMNILFNGYPIVMGTEQILIEWIKWRENVIRRSLENKLEIKKSDLHLSKGLLKISSDLDKVIEIIRFEAESKIIETLMKEFDVDDVQADYISSLQLRSLNDAKLNRRIKEIVAMKKEIKELEKNIKDDSFIKNILIDRMDSTIKNIEVGNRKTSVIEISENALKIVKKVNNKLNKTDNHLVTIKVTKDGFIFKSDKNGKMKSSPVMGDKVIKEFEIENDKQLAVLLPNITIGKLLVDDIGVETGEFIAGMFDHKEYIDILIPSKDEPHVLLGYSDGQLSKIPVESFITSRTITKNGFYDGAKLIFIEQIPENYDGDIKINYNGKKEKIVNLSNSNLKNGRTSRGQKFIPKNATKILYELI